MEYQHIRTELADNILTVTLNRPDRMNAFTLRMKDELVHVFGEADRDNQVRAVVVTGAGRAFCAGMEMQPEDGGHVFGYDHAEGAKIGFVFTQRGLTPEACSTWFLPRAVGMQKALEWVYSGDIFLAEEGLEAGLFRSLHGKEEVLDAALALARKLIAKSSPVSVALAKQMLWRNPTFDHPMQAHAVESRMIYRANEFWDGKDGFTAFLEKRDPVFDTDLNDVPAQFDFWPEPPLR